MQICIMKSNDEAESVKSTLTDIQQICQYKKAVFWKANFSASSLLWSGLLEGKRLFCVRTMSSKIQTRIGTLIRLQFRDYEIQENIRPAWLTSPEGERLELDFYIPELSLAFEIQGDQHYKFVPHFHRKMDDFANQVRRDQRKRELCIEHEIHLIEVASETEYKYAQDEIQEAMKSQVNKNLSQFVLSRVSQQLINCIALQEKIRQAKTELNLTTFKGRQTKLEKQIKTHVEHLEEANEIMRYVCVIAIQDFHGIEREKRRGWEFAIGLRRQGKQTRFERKRGKRQENRYRTIRKWA